ncbi:MAG: hypothetical protein DMF61_19585 [Blastocatellia bacterium AA13]|nr:MAG: hypothetical protein DMF61_19585 [Blastocatellia bacterium AA13]
MRTVSNNNTQTQPGTGGEPNPSFERNDRSRALIHLLFTIAAGGAVYGLFFNRGIWLSVVGYSVAPAERVLYGEVPYRDFLFNYTPGILWLNGLLMKLFGVGLMPIQVGLLVFKLLTLLMLSVLSLKLMRGWYAILPVALTLVWLGHRFIFNVHPTQYSMLFVLIGLSCMLKYDEQGKVRWLLLCGLSIGIVFLLKYNVGVAILGLSLIGVLLLEFIKGGGDQMRAGLFSRAVARLAILLSGFGIVVVPVFLYLASKGALGAMIGHFLHHASDYSDERAIPLPSIRLVVPFALLLGLSAAVVAIVSRKAPRLAGAFVLAILTAISVCILIPERMPLLKESASAAVAYLPPILFAVIGISLGVSAMQTLRREKQLRGWWSTNGPIALVLLFALGAYLEVYPRADYYHLIRVLPPVFLLVALAADRINALLTERAGSRPPWRIASLSTVASLALLAVVGVQDTWIPQFDGLRLNDRIPVQLERARGIYTSERDSRFIDELTDLIASNSTENDKMFSFARRGGGFYFFANRRNPTKLLWWDSVGIDAQAREEVFRLIAEKDLKLILVQDNFADIRARRLLDANYHEVGRASDIVVFDRNQ